MKNKKLIIVLSCAIVFIGIVYFSMKSNQNNAGDNIQTSQTTINDESTDQTDEYSSVYDYAIHSKNLYFRNTVDSKIKLKKLENVGKSTFIETSQYLELVSLYSQYYFYDNILIDQGSFSDIIFNEVISYDDIYTVQDNDNYDGIDYSRVSSYDLKTGEKTYEAKAGVTPFENYESLKRVVGAGNNFICFEDDKFIDLSKPNELQDAREYLKTEMNDAKLFEEYMAIDDEPNAYIDYMFVGRDDENNLIYECRNISDDILLFGPIKIKIN